MSATACKSAFRLKATRPAQLRYTAVRKATNRRAVAAKVTCVLDVSQATFDAEVLQSKEPVLVDVWATWCGPCKLVAPSMVWIEKEYKGLIKVVKVEADGNPDFIEKYKVYGLPTFLLFKDGDMIEGSHWEGALTKKQLVEYLQKHGVVPAKVDA